MQEESAQLTYYLTRGPRRLPLLEPLLYVQCTTKDPKGVHTYIHSHDNRMADRRYELAYNRANNFMKGYFSSDASLHSEVDELKAKYVDLSGKYDHLKELITSN